jgi:hypothetical protein
MSAPDTWEARLMAQQRHEAFSRAAGEAPQPPESPRTVLQRGPLGVDADGHWWVQVASKEQAALLAEIVGERLEQEGKGYDARHDEDHSMGEWVALLTWRLGKAFEAYEQNGPVKRRLVQVAAVALAALEVRDL